MPRLPLNRVVKLFFIFSLLILICILWLRRHEYVFQSHEFQWIDDLQKNNDTKEILFWTSYYSVNWVSRIKHFEKKNCPKKCTFTEDREKVCLLYSIEYHS